MWSIPLFFLSIRVEGLREVKTNEGGGVYRTIYFLSFDVTPPNPFYPIFGGGGGLAKNTI